MSARRISIFAWSGLALGLVVALGGCSRDSGGPPPEDAFLSLRTALTEQRWDIFYDVLDPFSQRAYDELIVQKDSELAATARQEGPSAADALLQPLSLSHGDWQKLDTRGRFAAIFGVSAQAHFMNLGLNPDHLAAATVRSTDVQGDLATLVVDDGKGHRTKLIFRLIDGGWRFDPSES